MRLRQKNKRKSQILFQERTPSTDQKKMGEKGNEMYFVLVGWSVRKSVSYDAKKYLLEKPIQHAYI